MDWERPRWEGILKDYCTSPGDTSWMTERRKWQCAFQCCVFLKKSGWKESWLNKSHLNERNKKKGRFQGTAKWEDSIS